MQSTVANLSLTAPKYHFHHEKGRVHLHLPAWLMSLIVISVASVLTLALVSYYELSNRKAVEKIQATKRLSLIQPPTPISDIKPADASAVAPTPQPVKIDAYNTGLTLDPGLQKILDTYNAATPPSGIVVLDDTDKIYAAIEPDQARTAASLYKLFVAREIYDFRAQGKLSFDKTITITQAAADQDNNDPNLPVGTSIQVSECLRRMIVVSDNACGYLLGNIIGWNNVNQTLQIKGYSQTSLGSEQLTSAADIGLLLRRISEGQMIDADSSHNLEAILFEQQINTALPALLPVGVMGHKTGSLNGLVHDAGIVRANNKVYTIVVLSGPWKKTSDANNSIAQLSRNVYDYIQNYKP